MSTRGRWIGGEVVIWLLLELPVRLCGAVVGQCSEWWRERPWKWS